jgi:hypothetical protein
MSVEIAIFAVILLGYLFVVGKVWRGESEWDPEPPAFWPFGERAWHGTARAFPVEGFSALLLIGAGIAADTIGRDGAGYDIAMSLGLAGLLGIVLLGLPITFFGRPRFLIPPSLRE